MGNTSHKTTLLTGVPAELGYLTGAEQEIIMDNSLDYVVRLLRTLAGTVKHVEGLGEITENSLRSLLSGDFRRLVEQLHLFTNDFERVFRFSIPFTAPSGLMDMVTEEVNLYHKEEVKGVKEGDKPTTIEVPGFRYDKYLKQVKSYSLINTLYRTIILTLPKSGITVRYTMPTIGEEIDFRNDEANAPLGPLARKFKLRNLCERSETEPGKEIWLPISPVSMHAKDVEVLTKSVNDNEGDIHSSMPIYLPKEAIDRERSFIMDVLQLPDFFSLAG